MKEHECHICGGLVPVLGGEFRTQGRRTVFVCVDCCVDDGQADPYEPPSVKPHKWPKGTKPKGENAC